MAGLGAAVALASSGGLDPSFGTSGTTVLDRPTGTYPTPAAVAPGGNVVLMTSANDKVTVTRLLADGQPDPSFNGDGERVIDASPKLLRGYAMALQPDGKILVAGSISNSAPGTDAAVWRLTTDGQLDPTFDGDGMAVVDSGTEDYAFNLALQPDGKIVIAGQTYSSPGPPIAAVWRLKAEAGPARSTARWIRRSTSTARRASATVPAARSSPRLRCSRTARSSSRGRDRPRATRSCGA